MGAWYVPKGLEAHFLVPATPASSSLVGAAHCRFGSSSAGFLSAGTLGRHDSHRRLLGVIRVQAVPLWVVVVALMGYAQRYRSFGDDSGAEWTMRGGAMIP